MALIYQLWNFDMRNIIWLLSLLLFLPACGSHMRLTVGAAQPLPLVPPISPTEIPVPAPLTPQENTPMTKPAQQRDPSAPGNHDHSQHEQCLGTDQL